MTVSSARPAAILLLGATAVWLQAGLPAAQTAAISETKIAGVVHEAAPTGREALAAVQITVEGRPAAPIAMTDALGQFTLSASLARGTTLAFIKAGYEPARITLDDLSAAARLDVAMRPEFHEITTTRSGSDDCVDLAAPPGGVPGLREYLRFPVHHDGTVIVKSAQLPFGSNPGYLYKQTPAGWVKNEVDYVLLRSPLPVQGGFNYSLAFGDGADRCGSWSVELTHPN